MIGSASRSRLHAHEAVSLVVVWRMKRAVDGNFLEIWTTETSELRVEIREETSLQERIVRKVDAWNDVAWMEGDLFGLVEKVCRITIERHLADLFNGHQLLRNDLGGVEEVKVKLVLVLLVNDLHAEFVFGIVAALDRLKEISTMKIRIPA